MIFQGGKGLILKLLNRKFNVAEKISNEVRNKIQKEVAAEFTDFDSVSVYCSKLHVECNEIQLHKGEKWIRFMLSSYKYRNGLYVRQLRHKQGNWTKEESRDIAQRLNGLF